MAPKGSCPTLLLPLLLLGTCLALASGQWSRPTYNGFVKRHWEYPKTQVNGTYGGSLGGSPYCDLQTRARGIRGSNTFIHERLAVLTSVCRKGGSPFGWGRRVSKRRLSLTFCRKLPRGGGYLEQSASRRIVVVCRNRLPVRFVKALRSPPRR